MKFYVKYDEIEIKSAPRIFDAHAKCVYKSFCFILTIVKFFAIFEAFKIIVVREIIAIFI